MPKSVSLNSFAATSVETQRNLYAITGESTAHAIMGIGVITSVIILLLLWTVYTSSQKAKCPTEIEILDEIEALALQVLLRLLNRENM